jgi:predicted dehydrogenase
MKRRQILKSGLLILPANLVRAYAANEKLNLGIIGLAGIGGVNARTFNALGQNIAALCDVDAKVLEKRSAEYPAAAQYRDFRRMIEREKLDGVIVATPDHTHAYITVWAMKHGLHVYCQKPLTQTVYEARVVARVAAETKVITQMGTQTSADPSVLRMVELVQSGALGEITGIHMATDRPIWPQGHDRPPGEEAVPAHLDWDLWLGPAAVRPFQAKWPEGHPVYSPERKNQFRSGPWVYHPLTWRGWTEFGSGALGDIAPHSMNVIFMALGLGAPAAVEIVETSGMRNEMYPDRSHLRFEFAARDGRPPLSIHWYDGNQPLPEHLLPPAPPQPPDAPPLKRGAGGMVWIGTKGRYPDAEPPNRPPQREWNREEVHKDWVTAIQTGKQAPCHFGYAGPFTEAYQLGNVALRAGHRIEWDAKAFRVTNCREANQHLTREYRKGWDLTEIARGA